MKQENTSTSTMEAAFAAAMADASQLPGLLQHCQPLLILTTRQVLGPKFNRRESESEIVQATVIEALRDNHMFRGQTLAEFLAWIKKLHRNNIQNRIRYHLAGKRDLRREVELQDASDGELSLSWRHAAAKSTLPEAEIVKAEKALVLAAAINRLPEAQRTAVTLRHIDGCSLAAICKAMDKSPAAVAGLLRRGLQALREQLGHESSWL